MANEVFSPRDFKAWIIEETVTGNASLDAPVITGSLLQLDVDSVAFPSLSPNQVTAVRSRGGRVLHDEDFFQDNTMRAIEVSLAGTFRQDSGTAMLMQSVTGMDLNATLADVAMVASPTGVSGAYGQTESNKTFTLVLASPDTTGGFNTVLGGCLCTSFSLNADMTADGGLYKFEATISSGQKPITNNVATESGSAFGSTLRTMSTLNSSNIKVGAITPVVNSFGVTIESPAIYTGFSSNGYHSFARGSEFTVIANATVKYDEVSKVLYHNLNQQTAITDGNLFTMPQTTATHTSVTIPNGFLTEVAFNEGDAMMLDVELQGTSDGSASIITFDMA